MNHVIAYELLSSELGAYRNLGYVQLRQLVGERSSHRKRAGDGVEYEITTIVRWCNQEKGDIRVVGLIGETGWGGPHDSLDDTLVVRRPVVSSV